MSISIHIDTRPEHGSVADQINEAMAALGFVRSNVLISSINHTDKGPVGGVTQPPIDNDHVAEGAQLFTADEIAMNALPARTPGQPSPGAKRRTKAEIAEDEAAEKLAASQRVAAVRANVLSDAEKNSAVDAAAARRDTFTVPEGHVAVRDSEGRATGETVAIDSAEDAAQDAADEAAEAAAGKTGLTHDDLRQAAGRYQKKFGMAAAVAGVPALLGCAIIDVPEADLAAAIAKIDNAVAGDAPGAIEEKVAEQQVEKAATKEDVMASMLRYALKFDGQNTDMNAMPKTMEDAPKIFTLLFGEGVVKLSQVPADGYAKTVAAFDEAAAKNPFKR